MLGGILVLGDSEVWGCPTRAGAVYDIDARFSISMMLTDDSDGGYVSDQVQYPQWTSAWLAATYVSGSGRLGSITIRIRMGTTGDGIRIRSRPR